MIEETCFECVNDLHGVHDFGIHYADRSNMKIEDEVALIDTLKELSFSIEIHDRRIAARLLMEVVNFKADARELLQRLTWDDDESVREIARQSILDLYQ